MRNISSGKISFEVRKIKNIVRQRALRPIHFARPQQDHPIYRPRRQARSSKSCKHKAGTQGYISTTVRKFILLDQILENWRSKRYIDPQKIDDLLSSLDARPKTSVSESHASTSPSSSKQTLSRNEVNKRIEQDRERHKRLRERRWVQPTLHNPASFQPPHLACFYPLTEPGEGQEELALDIEFENEWEATSDWNEDDEEAVGEEANLAFPPDENQPNMQTVR